MPYPPAGQAACQAVPARLLAATEPARALRAPSAGSPAAARLRSVSPGLSDASSHSRDSQPLSQSQSTDGMPDLVTAQTATYTGYIKTPMDAILLLAACDLPAPPESHKDAVYPPRRITRRLLDDERAKLIRSGSVFVWEEREAAMRRWTDGRCWSASRVSGCFLTYRELETRRKYVVCAAPLLTARSSSYNLEDAGRLNQYKRDGLIKQSFSVTTASKRKLHVISYYRKSDVVMGALKRVSEDAEYLGKLKRYYGLRVDEHEYGDLVSREQEASDVLLAVPEPEDSADRPKRAHSDVDAQVAWVASPKLNRTTVSTQQPRAVSVCQMPPTDDMLKLESPAADGDRYAKKARMLAPLEQEHGAGLPMPRSMLPSRHYAYESGPGPYVHARPAYSAGALYPPPAAARYDRYERPPAPTADGRTKLEHDSIAALVSLRGVYEKPDHSQTSPPLHLNMPSRMPGTIAHKSNADRDVLEKLSVRV